MSNKSFEKSLKNKVEEFNPKPKADMWDNIAAALPLEKKHKKVLLSRILAVAALLVFAMILLIETDEPSTQYTSKLLKKHQLGKQIENPSKLNDGESIAIAKENSNYIESSSKENLNVKDGVDNNTIKLSNQKEFTNQSLSSRNGKTNISNEVKKPLIEDKNSKHLELVEDAVLSNQNQINYELHLDAQNDSNFSDESKSLSSIVESNSIAVDSPEQIIDTLPDTKYVKELIKVVPRTNHFFIGLHFKPGITQTRVSSESGYKNTEPYVSIVQQRKESKEQELGYAFGAEIGYTFKRHFFKFGVDYFNLEYNITVGNIGRSLQNNQLTTYSRFDFNATDTFKLTSATQEGSSQVKNRFKYLVLPISYNYKFMQYKKLGFELSTALAANILLKHQGLEFDNATGLFVKSRVVSNSNIEKMHLSAAFGTQITFRTGVKTNVFLHPQCQLGLSPIESGRIRTSYTFWNLGLGFRYFL